MQICSLIEPCKPYFVAPTEHNITKSFVVATETLTVYSSNKLENVGASLTDTTRLINELLRTPNTPSRTSLEPSKAAKRREVLQHFQVLQDVRRYAKDKLPLTEEILKTWHSQLMTELLPPAEVGQYRREGVFAGEMIFPEAETVPGLMRGLLVQWPQKAESPFAQAAWLMHGFVAIHPFVDGNGRMSRLMCNYVLTLNGFPFGLPMGDRIAYLKAWRYADRRYDGPRRTGLLAGLLVEEADKVIHFGANLSQKEEFSLVAT